MVFQASVAAGSVVIIYPDLSRPNRYHANIYQTWFFVLVRPNMALAENGICMDMCPKNIKKTSQRENDDHLLDLGVLYPIYRYLQYLFSDKPISLYHQHEPFFFGGSILRQDLEAQDRPILMVTVMRRTMTMVGKE